MEKKKTPFMVNVALGAFLTVGACSGQSALGGVGKTFSNHQWMDLVVYIPSLMIAGFIGLGGVLATSRWAHARIAVIGIACVTMLIGCIDWFALDVVTETDEMLKSVAGVKAIIFGCAFGTIAWAFRSDEIKNYYAERSRKPADVKVFE